MPDLSKGVEPDGTILPLGSVGWGRLGCIGGSWLVSRSWLVSWGGLVSWGWPVCRGRLVSRGGFVGRDMDGSGFVCGSMNWGMVGRDMMNWGSMVGRGMNWGMNWSMDCVDWSMVDRGVDSMDWAMDSMRSKIWDGGAESHSQDRCQNKSLQTKSIGYKFYSKFFALLGTKTEVLKSRIYCTHFFLPSFLLLFVVDC